MTVPNITIIILAFLGILVKMLNQEKKKDKVILYDMIIISKPPKRKRNKIYERIQEGNKYHDYNHCGDVISKRANSQKQQNI